MESKKFKKWSGLILALMLAVMTACSGGHAPEQLAQSAAVPETVVGEDRTAGISENIRPEVSDPQDLDELTIHYMDVGQGDATLITCGDAAMLIDAGENDKGTKVQAYLKSQGVQSLDYAIGTHPDSDHIGGLDVIITKFDIGKVIMPSYAKDTVTYRDVISAMDYKGLKNTEPKVGTTYELGDAEFTIIAPNGAYGDDANNWSVGIVLQHGDNRFLFTGDAEEEAEQDIVGNGIDISCDVYQVGHHGSSSSSTDELLDAAKPAYAVISCGEGNSYGHPRAQTLNNFRARGIKVFRTDEQGTITVTSDGSALKWNASPSESWTAGEPTGSSQSGSASGSRISQSTKASQDAAKEVKETTAAPTEPQKSGITYVLNTKTKKFHRPSCGSLPTTNRKDTDMSRDEVIASGYDACKKCNP